MTAYGTEFFSMNDVNRLRVLQDVIDRRLTTRLAATRLEISDSTAAGYSSAVVNTDRYRWLTVDVVSLVTDS